MRGRRGPLLGVMALLVAWGCGGESGQQEGFLSEAEGARLIALPSSYEDTRFGLVSGGLGLNESGCFVIEDLVLVAAHGSRVLQSGDGIFIAGLGAIKVGQDVTEAAGGYLTDSDTVDGFLDETELRSEAEACGVKAGEVKEGQDGGGLVLARG